MSDFDENRADAYEAILEAMGDEKTVISPSEESSVIRNTTFKPFKYQLLSV